MLSKKEEKAINNMKKFLKEPYLLVEDKRTGYTKINIKFNLLQVSDIQIILNLITKLQKENEELKLDNLEKKRILEVFDDRKYRKKYLKERRKEEPDLLYPDGDEIYKRYYEQKKQIDFLSSKLSDVCTGIPQIIEQVHKEYCELMNGNEDCCYKEDKDCQDCVREYSEIKAKEKGE